VATLLYGIEQTDMVSLAAAAIGILAITLVATFVPARRASLVDPIVALRDE
jgi:ABC-type lipoprotein release transport system permease subunit